MNSTDRRVRRTQKSLGDALIALALEKDFDEITIQEITDRADIGCVAGKMGVKAGLGVGHNLQVTAALAKTDDRIIHQVGLETHAASTLDAALTVQDDQFTQGYVLGKLHFLVE